MKRTITAIALALALPSAFAADMTDDQKALYAVGMALGQQTAIFSLTPAEAEVVKKGFADSLAGTKPAVDMDAARPKIQQLLAARQAAAGQKAAAAGKVVLDKAAAEKGAVKTPSGLVYLSLREGKGASPTLGDTVKVNYRGTLPDGNEFDSSYKRGQPAEFPLGGVIRCWSEGVAKMKPGGKARLTCPPAIAYGDKGAGGVIPPNSTLTFEVELLSVSTPPGAGGTAASAPAAAKK